MDAETAYFFRHALLRDAAYELHPPSPRRALHRLALGILEELIPPAERGPLAQEFAWHAHQGQHVVGRTTRSLGLLRRELEYLLLAARWAEGKFDYTAAQAAWRACAAHPLASPVQRLTALTKVADALASLGHPEQASLALQGAETHAAVPEAARMLHTSRANVARHAWRFAEAEQEYLQALSLTDAADHETLAALNGNLAVVRMHLGRLADALQGLDSALRFNPLHAPFRQDRAIVLFHMGRREDALEEFRQAAEIAEHAGEPRVAATVLANYASVLLNLGRGSEVEAPLRRALQLQQPVGDHRGEATTLSVLGAHLTLTGRYRDALHATRRSVMLNREAGNLGVLAITLRNLAVLQIALGNAELASAPLKESLRLEREAGNELGCALTRTAQGMLAHARGNLNAAIELQREALAGCEKLGNAVHACDARIQLGRALRDAGRQSDAEAALQQALAQAGPLGRLELQAAATGHLALLWRRTRAGEAEAQWDAALRLCESCGNQLVRDELEHDRAAQG